MKFIYKSEIKSRLAEYLQMTRNINTKKLFKCLNDGHTDKKPSMGCKNDMVYCFTCNARYDIYNLIGQDYNLDTFKAQYEQACKIFNYDDEFILAKYKKDMQEIKDNRLILMSIEEQKEQRYNNFYNKLVDKKKEFEKIMESLSNYKDSAIYQEYQFKTDFITRFLNDIIEFNQESLDKINNFNKLYEYEYNQFRQVLEVI